MKKLDFLFIAMIASFICGAMLFTIFLIFRKDYLLYSIIPLVLCIILAVVGDIKNNKRREKRLRDKIST